jgi:hypothetical protein
MKPGNFGSSPFPDAPSTRRFPYVRDRFEGDGRFEINGAEAQGWRNFVS